MPLTREHQRLGQACSGSTPYLFDELTITGGARRRFVRSIFVLQHDRHDRLALTTGTDDHVQCHALRMP